MFRRMIIKKKVFLYSKSVNTLTPGPESNPPRRSTSFRGAATEVTKSKIYNHNRRGMSVSDNRGGGMYNLMPLHLYNTAQHSSNHMQAYVGIGVIGTFLLAVLGCMMFQCWKRLQRRDAEEDNPSPRRSRMQDDFATAAARSPVRQSGQDRRHTGESRSERTPLTATVRSVRRLQDDRISSSETSGKDGDELVRLTARNNPVEPVSYCIIPVQPCARNSQRADKSAHLAGCGTDVVESPALNPQSFQTETELKASPDSKDSHDSFGDKGSAAEVDHVRLSALPDITVDSSGVHTGFHEVGTDRYQDIVENNGFDNYAHPANIHNNISNEDTSTNMGGSSLTDEDSDVSEYLASTVLDISFEKIHNPPGNETKHDDSGPLESDKESTASEESFSRLQDVKAQAEYSPYHLAWTTPAGPGHSLHSRHHITATPHLPVKKKLCMDSEACKPNAGAEPRTAADRYDHGDLRSRSQGRCLDPDSSDPTKPLSQNSSGSLGWASESTAESSVTTNTTFASSFLRDWGLVKSEDVSGRPKSSGSRRSRPLSSTSVLMRRSLVGTWLETGAVSADDTALLRHRLSPERLPPQSQLPYSVEEYRRSLKSIASPGNTARILSTSAALDLQTNLRRESDCLHSPSSSPPWLSGTCSTSAVSRKQPPRDQEEETNKNSQGRNGENGSPEDSCTRVNRSQVTMYTQEDVDHIVGDIGGEAAAGPSFTIYLDLSHVTEKNSQDSLNNNATNSNLIVSCTPVSPNSPPIPSDASSALASTPSSYSFTSSEVTSSAEKGTDISSVSMLSKESDTTSPSTASESEETVAEKSQHPDSTTGFRPRTTAERKPWETQHHLPPAFTTENRRPQATEPKESAQLFHPDSTLTSESHEQGISPVRSSSPLMDQTRTNANCFKVPYPVDNPKRTVPQTETSMLPRSRSTTSEALSQHLLTEMNQIPLRRSKTLDWTRKLNTQELMSVGSSCDVSVAELSASRLSLTWDNEFTAFVRGPDESLTWDDDPFLY